VQEFVQLAVIGLIVGSIVGLGAMGLTLSYGILKFANFSHGDLMTLGMFLAFFMVINVGVAGPRMAPFSFAWGMIPAALFAMAGVALAAVAIDRAVYRRLRARGSTFITMAIASLGVAIMLRAVVQYVWGPLPARYTTGITEALSLGGVRIKSDQLLIIGLTVAIAFGLYLVLYRTRLGKAMRATSDNSVLADISGVDTERVRVATWAIAGALIAMAGIMFGIQSQLRFDAGFTFLLPMFAAVILGGIGNPWGALLGGLIVGLSQEMSTYWISSGYKAGVPFAILIAMLLIRPRGIFGTNV
jgi:branched-chain amino acid transport system permease protein